MNHNTPLLYHFNFLNINAKEDLIRRTHVSKVPKGKLLHLQGEVCDRIWYLKHGLVHSYYMDDSGTAQQTDWFAKENNLFTAFNSFLTQTPSLESIEVLEPSQLHSILRTDLYELYTLYPELSTIGRVIMEQFLIESNQKLWMMRRESAQQRLNHFQKDSSNLFLRVPQKYIASYLGISQNYLSKLKSNF